MVISNCLCECLQWCLRCGASYDNKAIYEGDKDLDSESRNYLIHGRPASVLAVSENYGSCLSQARLMRYDGVFDEEVAQNLSLNQRSIEKVQIPKVALDIRQAESDLKKPVVKQPRLESKLSQDGLTECFSFNTQKERPIVYDVGSLTGSQGSLDSYQTEWGQGSFEYPQLQVAEVEHSTGPWPVLGNNED